MPGEKHRRDVVQKIPSDELDMVLSRIQLLKALGHADELKSFLNIRNPENFVDSEKYYQILEKSGIHDNMSFVYTCDLLGILEKHNAEDGTPERLVGTINEENTRKRKDISEMKLTHKKANQQRPLTRKERSRQIEAEKLQAVLMELESNGKSVTINGIKHEMDWMLLTKHRRNLLKSFGIRD